MMQLLYTVIFAEMALIVIFFFKTPLRKLVIVSLDRAKRGRGPVVLKTIAATLFVVLLSSVYTIVKIQRRIIKAGAVNPTDQLLMSKHTLEASLIGFVLFLPFIIHRLQNYIRELRLLRKAMEDAEKQSYRRFEDAKNSKRSDEVKSLTVGILVLKTKINELESECQEREKEAKAAKTISEALKKQSEGLLLEYDRLLEDNQYLRNQLEGIDERFGVKKKTWW